MAQPGFDSRFYQNPVASRTRNRTAPWLNILACLIVAGALGLVMEVVSQGDALSPPVTTPAVRQVTPVYPQQTVQVYQPQIPTVQIPQFTPPMMHQIRQPILPQFRQPNFPQFPEDVQSQHIMPSARHIEDVPYNR